MTQVCSECDLPNINTFIFLCNKDNNHADFSYHKVINLILICTLLGYHSLWKQRQKRRMKLEVQLCGNNCHNNAFTPNRLLSRPLLYYRQKWKGNEIREGPKPPLICVFIFLGPREKIMESVYKSCYLSHGGNRSSKKTVVNLIKCQQLFWWTSNQDRTHKCCITFYFFSENLQRSFCYIRHYVIKTEQ